MKFDESNDGEKRMSVRVTFRVTLNDMIEICLRHKDENITKKLLIVEIRNALKRSGKELCLDEIYLNLALNGDPTKMIEIVEENDIEECKQIVLKHFPELKD